MRGWLGSINIYSLRGVIFEQIAHEMRLNGQLFFQVLMNFQFKVFFCFSLSHIIFIYIHERGNNIEWMEKYFVLNACWLNLKLHHGHLLEIVFIISLLLCCKTQCRIYKIKFQFTTEINSWKKQYHNKWKSGSEGDWRCWCCC